MEKFKTALNIVIAILVGIVFVQAQITNPKLKDAITSIGKIKTELTSLQADLSKTRTSIISLKKKLTKSDSIFDALNKDRDKLWKAEEKRRRILEKKLKEIEDKLDKSRLERIRLLEQANSFKK
ncbi:MAG: ELKS/Rab6-interacting/CAST family protein [Marinifilum sp.]|jgi:uncharacterized membrane-anchored protein YhcB (DUF1043 family)|nr:ELKS/Rab6-interacting/CAST family protein [Marinifilum sp.]